MPSLAEYRSSVEIGVAKLRAVTTDVHRLCQRKLLCMIKLLSSPALPSGDACYERHARQIVERTDAMPAERIHRIVGRVAVALSLVALLTVLSGYTQSPQPDEGARAHIFQLSIVAFVPVILLFLVTADWGRPLRSARALALSTVTLMLAFGALFYLEHYHWR